jgi:O-antigen ligase
MGGVLGLIIVLILTDVVIRKPVVAVGLILGVTVLEAALVDTVVGISPGGVSITVMDAVFTLVTVAAVARLLRISPITGAQWLVVVVGAIAVFSLARGVVQFGAQTAVNESRGFLAFFGAALYFSTVDITHLFPDRLRMVWLWGASGMAVLVLARWASWLVGVPIGVVAAQYDSAVRVLDGPQTFFLAIGFLLTLPVWKAGANNVMVRRASLLLGVGVILLNRRTVWATLIIGLLVLALRNERLGRRFAVILTIGAIATSVFLINLPETTAGGRAVAMEVTDTGTLEWRLQGWTDLLASRPDSPTNLVFGNPMGSGYTRRQQGVTVEQQPHNFYLQVYLRLGVVGVVLLAALYAAAVSTLLRASKRRPDSIAALLLVVLSAAHLGAGIGAGDPGWGLRCDARSDRRAAGACRAYCGS